MMSLTRLFTFRTLVLLAGMAAVLFLTACSGYGIAEVISTSSTGKTIPDHVVSLGSGKDCSTARYQRGHHYCKEDDKTLKQTNLYCYPTLGTTTCYDRPNPYDPRAQRNDRDKHNQGKPQPTMPPMDFLRPKPEPDIGYP